VAVVGPDGAEVGRGLTNYSAEDAGRIAGRKTDQLPGVLGEVRYVELIHRDNFAATG
jgi:glutamate 5-kinase